MSADSAPQINSDVISRRRFIDVNQRENKDPYGFFDGASGPPTYTCEQLVQRPAVLIVAPPWTGKSFVAGEMDAYFRVSAVGLRRASSVRRAFLSNLDIVSETSLLPDWWSVWERSRGSAVWIVDALDAEKRRPTGMIYRIIEVVRALPPKARDRLSLIMFSRENDVPKKVKEQLHEVYGSHESSSDKGLLEVRLARLDAESAAILVRGDRRDFTAMCRMIKANSLRAISGLPAVLKKLGQYPVDSPVRASQLWRDLLRDLFVDHSVDHPLPADVPRQDEMFKAAARIAACLTLSHQDQLDNGEGLSEYPSISSVFPTSHSSSIHEFKAAVGCLNTSVFRTTGTGYRIVEWHVQEWLSAFQLQSVPLNRLRPLVADKQGKPFARYWGVLALLLHITEHKDVKRWITIERGGITPRSGTVPLTLDDIRSDLDELQRRAETIPGGLTLYGDQGLQWFDVPGIGRELARRLEDKSIGRIAREFLLQIAVAVSRAESEIIAVVAVRVVLDDSEDRALRLAVLNALGVFARNDQLGELIEFLKDPRADEEPDIKANLVNELYHRKLLDFSAAAKQIPATRGRSGRAAFLAWVLEQEMDVPKAEQLLAALKVDQTRSALLAPRDDDWEPGQLGLGGLIEKAVQLLGAHDDLTPPQVEILLRLVPMASSEIAKLAGFRDLLISAIAKNESARRNAFESALESDPVVVWDWARLLHAQDFAWLRDLARRRGGELHILWQIALEQAGQTDLPPRDNDSIREEIRSVDPGILVSHDEHARRMAEHREQFEARRDSIRAPAEVTLEAVVQQELDQKKTSLHRKMLNLVDYCTTQRTRRYVNVVGSWEALTAETQNRVLDVYERALRNCKPTPIPPGNTYPYGIVAEPHCFEMVLRNRPSYRLNRVQIRKWLPATLIFGIPDRSNILQRCFKADRQATEDVVYREISRQMTNDSGMVFAAVNLPREFWTRRLAAKIARLADDDRINLTARVQVLRVLGIRSPSHAMELSKRWYGCLADEPQDVWYLRVAAVDVLLALDPDTAWPAAVEQFTKKRAEFLTKLGSLVGSSYGAPRAEPSSWSAQQIE